MSPPGELIDLLDTGDGSEPKPKLLVKAEAFNVMRLVLPAGKEIPEHTAPKEITVQCVRGQVEFRTMGRTLTMTPGQLVSLAPGEPHALTAVEDSIMLVTKAN